ncbi:PAS domain-containing protein [Neorhizobium sp. NPDC001467]|uniref:PAS domain-containing protein n=1 Tax=Neorhizobium sp. NPDC001467 TaxID=3390595 RepID=UPI003CFF1E01
MQTEAGNELFSYWLELKHDDRVPPQRSFKPARVRHLLPDLFILGKNDVGAVSFRLAGTRLCAVFGSELRGRPFAGLWHKSQRRHANLGIQTIMARGRPMVTDVTGIAADRVHHYQLVLLPMRSGETETDRVLGAILPCQPRANALLETISYLHAGESRSIAEDSPHVAAPQKGFSAFMRRLLSIQIVDDRLSGRS